MALSPLDLREAVGTGEGLRSPVNVNRPDHNNISINCLSWAPMLEL